MVFSSGEKVRFSRTESRRRTPTAVVNLLQRVEEDVVGEVVVVGGGGVFEDGEEVHVGKLDGVEESGRVGAYGVGGGSCFCFHFNLCFV
jgi:hypothetical protein